MKVVPNVYVPLVDVDRHDSGPRLNQPVAQTAKKTLLLPECTVLLIVPPSDSPNDLAA